MNTKEFKKQLFDEIDFIDTLEEKISYLKKRALKPARIEEVMVIVKTIEELEKGEG